MNLHQQHLEAIEKVLIGNDIRPSHAAESRFDAAKSCEAITKEFAKGLLEYVGKNYNIDLKGNYYNFIKDKRIDFSHDKIIELYEETLSDRK